MPNAYLIVVVHMLDGRKPQLELYIASDIKEARRFVKKWTKLELDLTESTGGYFGEARVVTTIDMQDGLEPVLMEVPLEADKTVAGIQKAGDWLAEQKR